MAWNSQVSHILATAAQNGSTIVWDLKQKKPWCELRESNRAPVTDIVWNPEQGQHLVTGEPKRTKKRHICIYKVHSEAASVVNLLRMYYFGSTATQDRRDLELGMVGARRRGSSVEY